MDSNTLGVITTLIVDIVGGFIILIGWLLIRRLRGDKKTIPRSFDDSELLFDENFEQQLEGLLEEDQKFYRKQSEKENWDDSDKSKSQNNDNDESIKTELEDAHLNSENQDYPVGMPTEGEQEIERVAKGSELPKQETVEFIMEEKTLELPKRSFDKVEEGDGHPDLDIDQFVPNESDEQELAEIRRKTKRIQTIRKFSVVQQTLKFRNSKNNRPNTLAQKPEGILDWFRILRNMSDEDLKIISGTDGALYIIFNRYAAIFFAFLTVISSVLFIPIYATGFPKSESDVQDSSGNDSTIQYITVLNVTGNNRKLQAVYALMMIFYTVAAFVFMFFYWKKSTAWRYRKHSHKDKFLDHDIALHGIMVSNLNRTLPVSKMLEKVKMVFDKIYPESKVVNVIVMPKLDQVYAMAVKLKKYRKLHRFYKEKNKGQTNRRILTKRKAWYDPVQRFDAEEYYQEKIKEKCREIRLEKDIIMKTNGGFGFVTFISNLQVKKCLYKSDFKRMVMENLNAEERMDSAVLTWKIKQAPSQSDIIWENMYKDDGTIEVKSWILAAILFLVCIVLITPITLIDNLQPIINAITKELGDANFLAIMLQTYISPLMFLAFNQGIVPLFIDLIAFLEGHKTRSRKQVGIMSKNFFFQIINTIFLQLTLQSTIISFLETISTKKWEDLPKELGKNLVSKNSFFIRYAIQLAFISNGIQLLDIPHHLVKTFKYCCHKQAQKKEIEPQPFVDDFAYDLGYYQSQAIVIFCLGIICSGTQPLITPFIFLFFTIKYYIEKYNLTFVYNKEFEGGGVIKKQVLPFMLFSIYLFQLLNLGYFSIFDDGFFKGGFIFITIQTLGFVFLNIHYNNKKREARKQLAKLEEQVQCEDLEFLENNTQALGEDDDKSQSSKMASNKEKNRKTKLMRFVDGNIMKGTERRLTIASQQEMSAKNILKLKEAYKHPFQVIPNEYFTEGKKIPFKPRKSNGINQK